MATNEIEIEVVLNSSDAEDGLAALEEGGEALGETFSGVGSAVTAMGGEINEQMGAVGESFGAVSESVMGLSDAVKGSGGSFLSLVGPIGMVTVALIEAYKAIEDFFGVTQDREIKLKAYEISVAELTVIIEELAAAQVTLTESEIEKLRAMSQGAKEKIEEAQLIRESTKAHQEQIIVINEEQEALEKLLITGGSGGYRFEEGGFHEWMHHNRLYELIDKRYALQQKINAENAKANKLVAEGGKGMAEVEELKEEYAKRGAKALKERAKLEATMSIDAQIKQLQSQEQTEKTKTQIAKLETQKRMAELQALEDVDDRVKYQAFLAEHKALKHRLSQIAKEERKAQILRQKQAEALRRMAAAKRLAEAQKIQAELARIQRAEIENARLNGASRLDILERQEALELELVGGNERAKQAIRLEFANKRIGAEREAQERREERARKEAEEAKRLAGEERRQAEQRQEFIIESMEFDLRMQEEGIDRELGLLELRFEREMRLREHSEEEITELTRRYSIERMKMVEANAQQGMDALANSIGSMGESIQRSVGGVVFDSLTSVKTESKEAFKQLSEDFREEERRIKESSENAAFVNQQMTELNANYAREREKIRKSEQGAPSRMIGELLTALGKQAAIESLMFLAKSAAAVFVNPPAAGGYLTAAGIMGTAAALAGYAGGELSALGAAASGGGSIAPSSPTGSPQSAPAPQRERAESTAMVFNINFGNSTIYDTKRAAQDAMASEILRTINRQRRGAPRFAMG
jgi:frataxin-like iron-binding protein CyaY